MSNFNLRNNIISLETAKTYARNNLLQFSITNEKGGDPLFSGILKNKPKFSINATYDRLINFDESFATINKIGNVVAGVSFGTSQTWTRQIFKGGSYLSISLQTRIIENVKGAVQSLSCLCSPGTIGELIGEKTTFTESYGKQSISAAPVENAKTAGTAWGLLTGAVNNTPPILLVKISNYFELGGFYTKSVDWEFSHEQTKNGPLYVDINLELENQDIRKSDDIRIAFGGRANAPATATEDATFSKPTNPEMPNAPEA